MASRMENSSQQLAAPVRSGADAQQAQRQRLLDMCARRELTDVLLLLQPEPNQAQQEVAAHRVVLAAASPFFRALFTGGMRESQQPAPRVPLPGVPAAAFRELLRYMYVGELRVAGDTILSVLHAANRLELQEVVEICCKQLMLELSVHNCVDIYVCCEQLQMRAACRLLARAARAMIDTFFSDVYQSEGFKNLSLDAVLKVLRHQQLGGCADCSADDAAVKAWMLHDPRTRQRELSVALQSPRGAEDDSTDEMILSRRNSDTAMVNSKERLSVVAAEAEEATDGEMLSAVASEVEDNAQQQLTPTIFVVGGFNNPGALNTVEYLDFHRGEWFPATPMATRRSYSGVAVPGDNKIYVMGGTSSSSQHHKTMERYDPETNVWAPMPPMTHARSYLGAAVVGDFIYAVGGFNGQAHLSSVERFDLRKQQWEQIPPLSTGRSGLAVVALNNLVYAIGGYDGRKHLKSVEVFDPQTNQWSSIASMRYARNGPAAVVQEHSNSILVFGGESRHGARMNTSERLDLNSGKWSDVDAFADCRSGHVAFSFLSESFLFCLGGSNKKDEYLDTVHRYDYLSKQWSLHSQMRAQRCGLNVAVVKTTPHAECFSAQRAKERMYKQNYFYRKQYRVMSAEGA
ncbi:kelch-like protein diablo [Phytophthora cinnamomi]|uniref:kelch-like protein diablo n=1 Tax=Phytophthora cinnamomi TaxID=4785 RepID=UPI003559EFF2|nr:kelch-like protein diablo [Phytophthora cinnamomi]